MKKNKLLWITTVVCLLPIILSIALYDKLPSEVAVHFNSEGKANDYMPKAFAAFGIPIMMAAINFFTHIIMNNDPNKMNSSATLKYMAKWIIPIMTVILMPVTLFIALGYVIPIEIVVPAFVGVIFVAFGNYLPKCKQNYTVGIRLPWTLNSEENWNKTHHMAGYLWIAGGIIITAGSLLRIAAQIIWIVIIPMVVIPFIYSYYLYKKGI